MAYELTGKLIEKYDTVTVSDRFKKREFVVLVKEERSGMEFTNYAKFELTQDRCDLIEPFNINDEIKVSFDISGRRWEKDGRVSYFTNLRAWRIEPAGGAPSAPSSPEEDSMRDPFADGATDGLTPPPEDQAEDDLPF